MITEKELVISNINKIHTTSLGVKRILKNINQENIDVVKWCQNKIIDSKSIVTKKGKNFYIEVDNYIITLNSYSYTIITVHTNK